MKRVFTAILALTLIVSVQSFAGSWKFSKVFPDTNFKANTGVHGIAVDKAGKVWIAPFGKSDSIFNGTKYVTVHNIWAFNPDGTPAAFSGQKIIMFGAVPETLVTASMRGMRADADGNIVYAASNGNYYRVNYQNGVGINKVKPNGSSTVSPAFTSANEMFTANVAPGNPINIYDASFASLGTAVASSIGYSRGLEVSKDGLDIFWAGYDKAHVKRYHSDLGTLGTYALVDSFLTGCQVESFGWNKKDGYLYMSSGPVDTINYKPAIPPPYNPETWYAWSPTAKAVKDSIVWNRAAYQYPGYHLYGDTNKVDVAPRPRGIAFSVTGDTAYVATYNYSKAAVQMFTRTATSVEPTSNVVPSDYRMSQNYPNPFNPSTEIEFKIAKQGMTTLKVYDMLGKEVATLVDETLAPGTYKARFDASRLASGTYIYTLSSNGVRMSNKMLLLK